ncbi:MAG: DNA primase [Prevotellaceae bacterium]|jgi:DNA primase|nr:DNA primase [Prevotellaceae bacterium]
MIDQATINKIFDTVDIVDVIQDFVSLKKRGANHIACCPFHDEKTPSFSVSSSKGIFKCFGCGKAGNAVTFVQLHENISYVEALKYVAKKYGIEIDERELTQEEQRQNDDRESILIALDYARQQFIKNLMETDEGKSIGLTYFKERGFSQAIINQFQLGYSLRTLSAFSKQALADGYKKEFLLKAGLCSERGQTGELIDFYAGRVIFPIHSVTGRVIAFGGRTLSAEKNVAKYKNSPESDVYVKNKTLYGLFFSKNAIVKKQKCYLVEGYTDVISMYQVGIDNVVASCGTSLTIEQAKLIRRFSPEVTVMYDGDSAGINASLRGIDILLEEGLTVKIVIFPDNEDPDSFARKHSASEVETFLTENEQDFIVFKSNFLLAESKNDPAKKAKVIGDIIQSVSVIPDNIMRMVYVKECSRMFDVDENTLVEELKRELAKKYYGKEYKDVKQLVTEKKRQKPIIPAVEGNCDEQEKELAYFLLKHGNHPLFENEHGSIDTVAQYIISELKKDDILLQNDCYKRIFNEYENLLIQNVEFSIKHFINNIDKQISEFAVNIISDEYELSEIWKRFGSNIPHEEDDLKRTIPRAITVYKLKLLSQTIDKFTIELNNSVADANNEKTTLITKKIIELNQIRKILSEKLKRVVS